MTLKNPIYSTGNNPILPYSNVTTVSLTSSTAGYYYIILSSTASSGYIRGYSTYTIGTPGAATDLNSSPIWEVIYCR